MNSTFEIKGRPASKKNSKQIFRVGNRTIIAPSTAYTRFEKYALEQLLPYRAKGTFTGPIRVVYYFYQLGRLSQDVDNAMASINDVLQKSGIIDDDKNIKQGSFFICSADKWFTEVVIESIRK